jgi:hypothetical protein
MPRKKTAPPEPQTLPEAAPEPEIVSVKGFGLDWKCRDFQFELSQTYIHDGKVEACNGGFHAIEGNPLEVFDYYAPGKSRYALVRQSGDLSRHSSDSKLASAKITIDAEINIPTLVTRAIEWVISKTTPANAKHAEGDQSAASSTGRQSAASSTGYQSAASSTGRRSAASSTGDQSAASSTGDQSAASSTGYQSAASSTGYQSAAMSAGYEGRVMAAEGCAMFLVFRDELYNIVHAWAGISGRDGIKPLQFYQLGADGKPFEVKN